MSLYRNGEKIAGYVSGKNSFLIRDITLPIDEFISQSDGRFKYTINSSFVTDDSMVDVYFSDTSQDVGAKARVKVLYDAGHIYIVAKKKPTAALVVEKIRIINPTQEDSY